MAIFLTRLADSRRVNDGHQLFNVVDKSSVEECFVPVLKTNQKNVFLEVCRLSPQIFQNPHHLLILAADPWGKESPQLQILPLGVREGSPFIQDWIVKQLHTDSGFLWSVIL
jgi:hypothetical protein